MILKDPYTGREYHIPESLGEGASLPIGGDSLNRSVNSVTIDPPRRRGGEGYVLAALVAAAGAA